MAITLPFSFVQGTVIDATQMDSNFSALVNGVNDVTGTGSVFVLAQAPTIASPTIATALTVTGTASVSGAVSLATPLAVASGGLGVATLPAGQLLQGNAAAPVTGVPLPLAAALGGTGQNSLPLSVANGGTGQSAVALFSMQTPAAGGAISLTTPTAFGAIVNFTPSSTGKLRITVSGTVLVSAVGVTGTLQLRVGTGTAPAYGAAAGGTVEATTNSGNEGSVPFSLSALVTLTAGVAAWADIAGYMTGTGNVSISTLTTTIDEKPV